MQYISQKTKKMRVLCTFGTMAQQYEMQAIQGFDVEYGSINDSPTLQLIFILMLVIIWLSFFTKINNTQSNIL